jgi:hypothetical protein
MKTLEDSHRPMKDVLSPLVKWVKDKATRFEPSKNTVQTENGDTIEYDYLVVATGMELNYEAIPGLVDALKVPKGPVCSIYSPLYVNRVYDAFQNFRGGNAIFTFPASPVKCPGELKFLAKLITLLSNVCIQQVLPKKSATFLNTMLARTRREELQKFTTTPRCLSSSV